MKHTLLLFLALISLAVSAQEQFAVYFDFDEAEANLASQERLAIWLENHRDANIIKIYGYADTTGTLEYNVQLSQRRAGFVVRALKDAGYKVLPETQIKGFGETSVFSENHSTDRLVMIHYHEPEKPPTKVSAVLPEEEPAAAIKPFDSGLTLAVSRAKAGDRLRLPNMNFYLGVDIMTPESKPVLEELLAIMENNPSLKIVIEGHICCDRLEGDRLSIRRARAVYRYLTENGISKKRLDYRGYAGTSPIHFIPEKNDREKAENRRVEIHITAK